MNITIMGNGWTAEQLESLVRGLRQVERLNITTSPFVISDEAKNWKPSKAQRDEIARAIQSASNEWPFAKLNAGTEVVGEEIDQTEDETAEWFTGEYGTISEEDTEWMAADLSARPDTWEIEEPMRFQSFAHMPLNDRGQAECITVLAYHLWQLEERLTGGDGSHKSCDPIRIEWDGSEYIAFSYVFSPLEWESYKSLADVEAAIVNLFAVRMIALLDSRRKRAGAKW